MAEQPEHPVREPSPSAGHVVGLLADPIRRKVFAAIVLGAATDDDVVRAAGVTVRQAVTGAGRLVDAGLVERASDGTLSVVASALVDAARASAPPRDAEEHGDQPPDVARVLRAHVKDGRLVTIPSSHAKRLVVLDVIVQDFEPDTHYAEREVNAILSRWHPDYAALRRWLVDVGFLDRDHGDYWRSGGSVMTAAR